MSASGCRALNSLFPSLFYDFSVDACRTETVLSCSHYHGASICRPHYVLECLDSGYARCAASATEVWRCQRAGKAIDKRRAAFFFDMDISGKMKKKRYAELYLTLS